MASSETSTSTSAAIMTRQSSDGSEGFLSDPCASPPSSSNVLNSSSVSKPRTMFRSSGGLSSPPPLSSSSGYGYRVREDLDLSEFVSILTASVFFPQYNYPHSTPGSPPVAELPPPRTNSVGSTGGTSPRRFYKRPLRGPYGELLELEMNRVGGRNSKNRELEDFCRESRSSSPPPNSVSESGALLRSPISNHKGPASERNSLLETPKLGNSLHELRMSGWTEGEGSKHGNLRSRKISANIPVSLGGSGGYHTPGKGGFETLMAYDMARRHLWRHSVWSDD